jgi:C4-dicarboxylate transporter DctM subunit
MGIPEMRKRGYPDGVAAGSIAAGGTLGILIPPSVTMIVYGIATETSIGRLFLAGVIPGLLLVGLFMAWSLYSTWRSGDASVLSAGSYTWKERFEILPRVLPFLAIIVGVLYAMYGGIATPSETAAVGALMCLVIAMVIYKLWNPRSLGGPARQHQGKRDDPVHHRRCRCLFLHAVFAVHHPVDRRMDRHAGREPLGSDGGSQHLPADRRLLPAAGRRDPDGRADPAADHHQRPDSTPIWFAVVLTINMEIGLISPPVGLNSVCHQWHCAGYLAEDHPQADRLPFVGCMVVAIILLCLFPGLATWLPDAVMGDTMTLLADLLSSPSFDRRYRTFLRGSSDNRPMEELTCRAFRCVRVRFRAAPSRGSSSTGMKRQEEDAEKLSLFQALGRRHGCLASRSSRGT